MKTGIGRDRAQSRQNLVNDLFQAFIEQERADPKAYHNFCNWAAGKSHIEIERELKNFNGRGFWK